MKLSQLLATKKFVMSAEVFPPKRNGMMEGVIRALKDIKSLSPDFVSITYGAGGKGGATTADVASVAIDAFDLNTVAHLTAVNMTTENLETLVKILKNKNVENILALRGDVGEDDTFYDFCHATDVMKYLSLNHPEFEITGACYPEGHSEAESLDKDLEYIKLKEECGAKQFVSQLFFSNDTFYRFLDKALAAGVHAPVIAGIMPIVAESQIARTVKMCGVEIPADFAKLISNHSGDDLYKAGIDYAIAQIDGLIRNGVRGAHIYTMNRGAVAQRVFEAFPDAR